MLYNLLRIPHKAMSVVYKSQAHTTGHRGVFMPCLSALIAGQTVSKNNYNFYKTSLTTTQPNTTRLNSPTATDN